MADIIDIDVFQTVTSVSFEVEPNTNIININKVTSTEGGGATNLTTSQTATDFTINSDTGDDALVPLGNGTLAGGTLNNYTTAEKNKLAAITGTNTGDQNLQSVTNIGASTNKTITINPTVSANGLNINTTWIDGEPISKGINIISGGENTGIYINNSINGNAIYAIGNGNDVTAYINGGDTGLNLTNIGSTGIAVSGGSSESINVYNANGDVGLRVYQNLGDAILLNLGSTSNGITINSGLSSVGNTIVINKNGVDKLVVNQAGELTAQKLIKSGGTPSQILAADGSVITAGTNITISGGTIASTGGGIRNGTTSGTDTYTATISGVTSYVDGDAYLIRFTNGNTTGATLNINGLGAIALYRNNDGALIGGDIQNGGEMLCVYNSTITAFQCIGTSPNDIISYVTNADSVTITKGMPVYAFGGTGDRMTVKRAYNTLDATSAQTVGLVMSTSIAAGQKGIIITQGLLYGLSTLPTSTFADGDTIYLGATAGTITNIKPYAPNHLVYLGVVTTASAGAAGRMYVKVQNGYELDELHNVQAQNPTLKDTLWYDNTVSPAQWKTASIPTILGYTPYNATNPSGYQTSAQVQTIADAKVVQTITNGVTTTAPSQDAVFDALALKQDVITLTTTGTSGASTLVGATLNIPQYSGATNLGYTAAPTNGTVTSSTGSSATLPLADATNAGLLKPAKFTVLENTSGTNTGDQNLSGYALLASPAFTGTPSLPTGTTGTTQTPLNNSTRLATTAYVEAACAVVSASNGVTVSSQDTFGTARIATVTAAQYAAFVTAGTVSSTTLYFITA